MIMATIPGDAVCVAMAMLAVLIYAGFWALLIGCVAQFVWDEAQAWRRRLERHFKSMDPWWQVYRGRK